jgi:hypothetical protein
MGGTEIHEKKIKKKLVKYELNTVHGRNQLHGLHEGALLYVSIDPELTIYCMTEIHAVFVL